MNKKILQNDEINAIRDRLVETLSPRKIYLFGSFANGTYNDNSDYDFYIIVPDSKDDRITISQRAYKALRGIRKRPVDVVVGYEKTFNARKDITSIENVVNKEGVLIYG